MKYIDFRSDTVTNPTQEMREAMYMAEVGDDVYGDDPTVAKLEERSARIVGKEAALFVPSGTFGNQLALFTHCKRGDEVIIGDDCHIVEHEAGASSVISSVQLRTLASDKGALSPDDIESKVRIGEDIHTPSTGLICIENPHSNGRVIPLENMEKIYGIAKNYNIPVHMDGARIFNAAAYLGVGADKIAKYCDSVMFCLSKGLCAPVGSILAGSREFIRRARKGRKLMGGGMRQAGIIAAAGIVALEKMTGRIVEDRNNALLLGEKLSEIPGIKVNMDDIHINMVFADLNGIRFDPEDFAHELLKRGIRINTPSKGILRLVTHYWISAEDIMRAVSCIREILQKVS